MGRYRKILVAVDGSDASMHALKECLKLAGVEKSWVTVVSVAPKYEGDLSAVWVSDVGKSMAEPCQAAISKAKKLAEEERALIKTVCEQGDIYERIVDLADSENCDLIVMGKKGQPDREGPHRQCDRKSYRAQSERRPCGA
jgi:nucleotide-binding universal stress UspA family protein